MTIHAELFWQKKKFLGVKNSILKWQFFAAFCFHLFLQMSSLNIENIFYRVPSYNIYIQEQENAFNVFSKK